VKHDKKLVRFYLPLEPKNPGVQGRAKELIHEMYLSPTRKAALAAYDQFIASYQAKYPKATDCLEKGAPSYPADQGLWLPDRHFDHGLQTGNRSSETLAPA
jgi:hypothetical protein